MADSKDVMIYREIKIEVPVTAVASFGNNRKEWKELYILALC